MFDKLRAKAKSCFTAALKAAFVGGYLGFMLGITAIAACAVILLIPLLWVIFFGIPMLCFQLAQIGFSHWVSVTIIAVVTVLCATGLFALRQRARLLYGVLECIVALAGLVITIDQILRQAVLSEIPPERWISFGGAIYVIVRGFDNATIGIKEVRQFIKAFDDFQPPDGVWF